MQELIKKPLNEVDIFFKSCHHDPEKTVEATLDFFKKQLDCSTNDLLKVPSLNDIPQEQLMLGQLVRFRCMIQDMYDPEYFMPTFYKDDALVTSLFRDPLDENFGHEFADSRPVDRYTWHCIAVPAENEWVNNGYQRESNTSASIGADLYTAARDEEVPVKKRKSEQKAISDMQPLRYQCFPLSTHHKSCIVKVYSHTTCLGLNDVIEVVGIISRFPERAEESQLENICFGTDEYFFKNPPTSVIPRIHAVFCKKIFHQNPLLGYHIEEENAILRRRMLEEAPKWRNELMSILTQALLGDEHTAEYVLLHLISRVYIRHDVLPLGKFSLNLRNANAEHAKLLAQLFSQLLVKSHLVEMSLEFLNGTKFIPSKDYDLNRIESGLLQLPNGTHLICDENALDAGQLSAVGVENFKALGNMIQNQTVQYNFGFHRMEFDTDVPVLYVSQGKGLIRCDFQVKLHPVKPVHQLPEVTATIKEYLTDELLLNLRRYITITEMSDHKLNEEMQRTVQDDFVSMRAANPTMTADDLHNLLVVARYVALSKGELDLTLESWNHAKGLEAKRLASCA
ncbi:mini-chromosome maintenance complex-binding protein-like [Tropilaelaps mercedesae]|uniref:Mini-chromosome maintenance complex-binding protein n=1 Tax=Tropilaelaps mercedesae TaxID=418985 RepID=A0A1V9WYC3_9ACAR|nr:mini-chromosome maintenance complex-binding protein-like [Tropilaelaps mercedesae]